MQKTGVKMSSFLSSFLTLRRLGHDLTAVSAAAAAAVGAQASQILRRRSLQVRTLFRHRQSLGGVLVAVGRVRVAVGRVLVAVGRVRVAVGASGRRQGGQIGHVHVDRLRHH